MLNAMVLLFSVTVPSRLKTPPPIPAPLAFPLPPFALLPETVLLMI
jgi:hypothetical protein